MRHPTTDAAPVRVLKIVELLFQRVLDGLEREALVVSRKAGVERRFTLNPRFFARSELRALLLRLGEQDSQLQQALAARRSRPRRRGKPL